MRKPCIEFESRLPLLYTSISVYQVSNRIIRGAVVIFFSSAHHTTLSSNRFSHETINEGNSRCKVLTLSCYKRKLYRVIAFSRDAFSLN